MPDVQINSSARRALIALMVVVEEATNPIIHDRFGFDIDKPSRQQLETAGFVTCGKGRNNVITYKLTQEGWCRGRLELAGRPPAKATPLLRLMYGLLNVVDRHMTQSKLEMDDLFQVSIEDRVRATYRGLAKKNGDLVSLALLRDRLPDIARPDLDQALKAMDRSREIQLDPDPNRKALPAEAHAAAVRIGGEDKHLLTMSHR